MLSVEARLALQDRYVQIAYGMDSNDPAWTDVFAEDGEFVIVDGGSWSGRAAIRTLAEQTIADRPSKPFKNSMHRVSNFRFSGDGDLVRGLAYVEWQCQDKESGSIEIKLSGVYVDDWRRDDGSWLLTRRELRPSVPRLSEVGA